MNQKAIRKENVQQALRTLGERVRTKQVSSHPAMIAGHPELAKERNYHAWVGTYLSQECDDVERLPAKDTRDGALWLNLLSDSAEPLNVDRDANSSERAEADGQFTLGPQAPSDKPFTARMRLHQSWYRAHVLRVPFGTGPEAASTRAYGNMLRDEEAERGLNFITPEILQAAKRRLAQGTGMVEPFRLMHNMLSSQPLCFNLFAPLAADLELATQVVRTLPGLSVKRVLRVELELTPGTRGAYLDDHTAFDAYIEYEQTDGRLAFIGVEVKLTEPFSQKAYDTAQYRRWMAGERSPWRQDAAEKVARIEHNQLWRDHLLAVAHRDQKGSPYAHGRLLLVRHPEDRSCERVVSAYSQLLQDGDDTLMDMPLDRLVALWAGVLSNEAQRSWLAAVKERYLDLEESQALRADQKRGG